MQSVRQDRSQKGATRATLVIGVFLCILLVALIALWFLPLRGISYSSVTAESNSIMSTTTPPAVPVFVVTHIATPDYVKAAYFTSWAAGSSAFRKKIADLFSGTELNAAVVDVKDYSGRISFHTADPELEAFGSPEKRIPGIKEFIGGLHDKGVYVIARVAVFQDPYAVTVHPEWAVRDAKTGTAWRDAGGAYWLDPANREVWAYIVEIATESYAVGFDEINFDYIRFPSDGRIADAVYSKSASTTRAETITEFFSYLHDSLSSQGIPISADLYGQTTSDRGDMGIGQVLENALPYFDFVSPMIYPSHFINGFIGYAKPAAHPYEVVKYSLDQAIMRALAASTSPNKIRPWLQAFDLGAIYTPTLVEAQMQATYDAGLNSWLLWNAASIYNKEAVTPKQGTTTIVSTTTVSN